MKWVKEQIEFLKNTEGNYEVCELAKILNRTKGAIKRKLGILNIKQGKERKEIKFCIECSCEFECYIKHDRKFCSSKCSTTFNNKNRDPKIYKELSETLKTKLFNKRTKSIYNIKCVICEDMFKITGSKRRKRKTCSKECLKKLLSINASKVHKELAKNLDRRNFLKEIGRKGGFGTKGYTDKNVFYQSLFEKNVFEYLDNINIKYEPHKCIPNTSKVSDLFLCDYNIWIELDGIDREKRKKWLGKDYDYWIQKLSIYKSNNYIFEVFKNVEDFKVYINNLN